MLCILSKLEVVKVKEILKKYSPKRENVNLGWLNKHLTDPELWKWNKKTIAKAFAIGFFCAFLTNASTYPFSGNFSGFIFC